MIAQYIRFFDSLQKIKDAPRGVVFCLVAFGGARWNQILAYFKDWNELRQLSTIVA